MRFSLFSAPPMDTSSSSSPKEESFQGGSLEEKKSESFSPVSSSTLHSLKIPEEKIAEGLKEMRCSLAQEGVPRFKEFWEMRKALLSLFKENLNPLVRSKLWAEYIELTVEARHLKEILEEESVFAMEQIGLAIESLQAD